MLSKDQFWSQSAMMLGWLWLWWVFWPCVQPKNSSSSACTRCWLLFFVLLQLKPHPASGTVIYARVLRSKQECSLRRLVCVDCMPRSTHSEYSQCGPSYLASEHLSFCPTMNSTGQFCLFIAVLPAIYRLSDQQAARDGSLAITNAQT